LRYVHREAGPAAGQDQITDAPVDWLDDDELLSSEHLDDVNYNVSSPKKQKIC